MSAHMAHGFAARQQQPSNNTPWCSFERPVGPQACTDIISYAHVCGEWALQLRVCCACNSTNDDNGSNNLPQLQGCQKPPVTGSTSSAERVACPCSLVCVYASHRHTNNSILCHIKNASLQKLSAKNILHVTWAHRNMAPIKERQPEHSEQCQR